MTCVVNDVKRNKNTKTFFINKNKLRFLAITYYQRWKDIWMKIEQ